MALTRKDFLRTSALLSTGSFAFSSTAACTEKEVNVVPARLIKPKPLKEGATLGLVAPGSPIYEDAVFDEMLLSLKDLGFKLKLGENVRSQRGYLAGTDQERATDLMKMFTDPEVDGILCIRGGYGCNRILPLLDFDLVKANPKVFCGFSDITSLHMAFYHKSGLHTFHGPVGKSKWNSFTADAFRDITFHGRKKTFAVHGDFDDSYTIFPGKMEGLLLGGNLSVLVSLIGSEYLPSFENAVLFLEDVGESVYRVDRMLTQLKLSGILDQISGFVFGKCSDCGAGSNSLSLQQVFDDHIKPLNIPAFYGAMISHEDYNITLPVGISARINSVDRTIQILGSAVS